MVSIYFFVVGRRNVSLDMINDWHIKMDESNGGGFESLEFHPVHVNAAFGVTSAGLWNASEPQPNCLLKLNVKVELCCITCLEMSSVTSVSPRFPEWGFVFWPGKTAPSLNSLELPSSRSVGTQKSHPLKIISALKINISFKIENKQNKRQ